MTPEQQKAFIKELDEYLETGITLEEAVHWALYDTRTAGLEALTDLEDEMQKYDLAQLGEALHEIVVEANHGSWDGCERPQLEAWNMVLGEILFMLREKEPGAPVGGYCAGGAQWIEPHGKVAPMHYPEDQD